MATSYPGALDVFPVYVAGGPNHAGVHTDVGDAIEAIQAELGVNPSGNSATVADRLNTALGSNVVLRIRYTGATVPLRNTVTTDLTQMVIWVCPSTSQPTTATGYFVEGVDEIHAIFT